MRRLSRVQGEESVGQSCASYSQFVSGSCSGPTHKSAQDPAKADHSLREVSQIDDGMEFLSG